MCIFNMWCKSISIVYKFRRVYRSLKYSAQLCNIVYKLDLWCKSQNHFAQVKKNRIILVSFYLISDIPPKTKKAKETIQKSKNYQKCKNMEETFVFRKTN